MLSIKYNFSTTKQAILLGIIMFCGLLINPLLANAKNNIDLTDMTIEHLSREDVKIVLKFSDMPRVPRSFVIDSPVELVMDFDNANNKLPKEKIVQNLALSLIHKIYFANNGDRLRMVIGLNNSVPYTTQVEGNNLVLTIKNQLYKPQILHENDYTISALNFQRGDQGEGRLILDVKQEEMSIDLKEQSEHGMAIEFKNATIPDKLLRRFDVSDFGTPIKNIIISKVDKNVLVTIKSSSTYEKISYHMGDKYIVEAKPIDALEQEINKARKFKFTGEKISLNFQDIEIRAVLQLLADFTGLNIIANDSVNGNVTLRLDNIPWDQALDFILKSRGLGKRETGNVVLIAPTDELSKYEEAELNAIKQLESLATLKTEFIQINYAKPEDVMKMIKGEGGEGEGSSMLSDRGTINVDARTNMMMIKDAEDKISDIKDLIKILDVPVKQVLIEAYLVNATDIFLDSLGIVFKGSATARIGNRRLGVHGGKTGTDKSGNTTASGAGGTAMSMANQGISAAAGNPGTLFSNPVGGPLGLGLALSRLPGGTLLNLELDIGEEESISKSISKPRILTLDKQSASIESGQDVPYKSTDQSGNTTTTFQKASLSLEVTPQIMPNNQISMEISINNDSPGPTLQGTGQPSISTTSLQTSILVNNGETIILGGLSKDELNDSKSRIPFVSDLPFIGRLFDTKGISNTKTELLVFITPRVIQPLEVNKDL
jgi:type IV pilus assembly protein PilQ